MLHRYNSSRSAAKVLATDKAWVIHRSHEREIESTVLVRVTSGILCGASSHKGTHCRHAAALIAKNNSVLILIAGRLFRAPSAQQNQGDVAISKPRHYSVVSSMEHRGEVSTLNSIVKGSSAFLLVAAEANACCVCHAVFLFYLQVRDCVRAQLRDSTRASQTRPWDDPANKHSHLSTEGCNISIFSSTK